MASRHANTRNVSNKSRNDSTTPHSATASAGGRKRPQAQATQRSPSLSDGSTPSKPLVVFRDLSDYASAYCHKVSEVDKITQDYCKDRCIPIRLVAEAMNLHAVSHVSRDEFVRQTLIREGRGKTSLRILDWFGSGRNLKFNPRNGPYGKVRGDGGLFLASSKALSIDWVFGPDDAIAGDASRGMLAVRSPLHECAADIAIVQDIYQDGRSYTDPFSAATCKRILHLTVTNRVYVCNRLFQGECGADICSGTKEEQVFYRDSEGLIVSSPDAESTPYASHPDTNWIAEHRSYHGIDITPLQSVGPYFVVRISPTPKGAQKLGPLVPKEAKFEYVELYEFSWGRRMLQWISARLSLLTFVGIMPVQRVGCTVLVHIPTLVSLGLKFAVKSPNGQILDSLIGAVDRSLESDQEYKFIRKRFPSISQKIAEGTVLACLHHERSDAAIELHGLRTWNVMSEHTLAEVRAVKPPETEEPPRSWKKLLVIFFLALVTMFLIPLSNDLPIHVMDHHTTAGAYLLPQYPILSAFAEECLGWVYPSAAYLAVWMEFFGSVERNPRAAVATLLMHAFTRMLRNLGVGGLIAALIFHVGWNWAAPKAQVRTRFSNFLEIYSEGMVLDDVQEAHCVIPMGTMLPAYHTKIRSAPVNFRGVVEIFVDGVVVTAEEAFELLESDCDRNGLHPILITNRVMHQPANVESNLLAAVLHRLHNDPFCDGAASKEVRHANWEKLADVLIGSELLLPFSAYSLTHSECFALMGKKGARLARAWDEWVGGHIMGQKKTINLKWNETLSVSKEIDGIMTMKPRAIQNLEPSVHALMAPFARVLNYIMHENFDGRVLMIGKQPVRIIFASGSTGQQLNAIGEILAYDDFTIVVSGDDSVVSFGATRRDLYRFGEADQSAFDHTQDEGPCLLFQSKVQEYLGFPPEFTKLAYQCCSQPYTARKKRLFMKGECGTQMPTGITTTTTYNSLSTAMFWIFWFLHREDYGVVEAGQQLGFKVKFEPRTCLSQATFLKGWWLENRAGAQIWFPLPSACLKLGKLLKSPLEITRSGRKGKAHRPWEEAIRMCAFALSSSFGNVPDEYPILGAFLGVLRRCGVKSPTAMEGLVESWKPCVTACDFDRDFACQAVVERYGVLYEEILSVENLLGKIVKLPSYVEHPVFDKLASVDY